MLDALRRLIRQRRGVASPADATPASPDEVQLAATALLLELGYADGEFAESERGYIESALARHFNLPEPAVRELLALAESERRRSVDHFQFTRVVRDQLDVGQRMLLAEVMWGVILADGHIGDHESYLMRKLGHLLDLAPGYLADARRAASARRQP